MVDATDDSLPQTTEAALDDGSASVPTGAPVSLDRGSTVGRYVVLERVGAGGMGVVFAAYDPELDRRVALKILIPRGGDRSAARARLLREAQALARLSHPNVVSVHDAGVDAERVFIAMEFVEGLTLRKWVQTDRPVREVLGAFTQAAEGLAAAHAVGLVHRDFKPDNVMVGDDGRVRVMDFGLAQAAGDEVERVLPQDIAEHSTSGDAFALRLTRTGAAIGTPAYMAPEQFAGTETDARTDQFSFCVALYEVLYGQRPFEGRNLNSLSIAVLSGTLREPPSDVKVSGHLARAVRQGLSREPGDRHSGMAPLIAALARDPASSRRRMTSLVLAGGLLGGAAFAFGSTRPAGGVIPPAPQCANLGAGIAETWNPEIAGALAVRFGEQASYGGAVAGKVVEELDRWTERWIAMRTDACEATRIRGVQSEGALELRIACLDARHHRLAAAVEVLGAADAAVVREAVDVVDGLPSLARCADLSALRAAVPPPEDPKLAAAAGRARLQLDKAESNVDAGKFDAALEHAEAAAAEIEGLGLQASDAEVGVMLGQIHERRSDHELARTTLEQAFLDALEVGDDASATGAAASLTLIVGDRLAKPDEGQRWARQAVAMARRPPGYPAAEARAHSGWGVVLGSIGDAPAAIEHHEAALDAHARAGHGERAPAAATLDNLGLAYGYSGDHARADDAHRRALAIFEDALGDTHPETGYPLYNLALSRLMQGHPDEALPLAERGHAIWSASLGDEHELTVRALELLGMTHADLGDLGRAEESMSAARTALAKQLGEDHPSVASADGNLAIVYRRLGRLDDALAAQERGLASQRASLGADHPSLAFSLDELAAIVGLRGDRTRALALATHAVDLVTAALGAEHPDTLALRVNRANALRMAGKTREAAHEYALLVPIIEAEDDPGDRRLASLAGLGLARLDLGDSSGAVSALERAVRLTPSESGQAMRARAAFGLAKVIAKTDPERATTLVAEAEAHFSSAPASLVAEDLAEVRAWTAARGGPG